MARTDAPSPRIAYVHIPFCANHCLFCGFYRNAYVPATAASYVDHVIRDIEAESSMPAAQAAPVEAVYLGGGTPSALTAPELSRLLQAIRRYLPLAPDCEITVEGRIIHFDGEKVAACLEAGANRFSIGVQSFDTTVRRRQGRRAGREEAIAFIEGLNARSGAAIVIDLMYGLPGQTDDVWRQDLEIAAALAPDGIDLYGLNLIPGTPLHQAMQAGKFAQAPVLADLGRYYRTGSEFLGARGWGQVSNNHWARTALERNRYNRMIKEGADCLAYGSGAGGSLGQLGYGLTGNLDEFAAAVGDGRKPIGMMSSADSLRTLRNFIVGGLEAGRLEFSPFDRMAGRGLSAEFRPLFEQWASAGLVTLGDGALDLTLAGRFWYSTINAALHDLVEARLLPRSEAA
jgi:oxygen-independent coproporphyrinogen-3 oxidase